MKKWNILLVGLLLAFSISTVNAQNDTMYVMKNGAVVGKYNVKNQVDSVIFYNPTESFTFTDARDGNVYNWVQIGNQKWMAENLAYLPSVSEPWTVSETAPHYYVYGYEGTDVNAAKTSSNYSAYGVLYNWAAAMNGMTSSSANPSGVLGICPNGWHLPSDAEWTELIDYVGGTAIAGGKLKETGTNHWVSPNTGATNETDFAALGGGYNSGSFSSIGIYGLWWSATKFDGTSSWRRRMDYNNGAVNNSNLSKGIGFSIRCVKD